MNRLRGELNILAKYAFFNNLILSNYRNSSFMYLSFSFIALKYYNIKIL